MTVHVVASGLIAFNKQFLVCIRTEHLFSYYDAVSRQWSVFLYRGNGVIRILKSVIDI